MSNQLPEHPLLQAQFGQDGVTNLTDTTPDTGSWHAVQVLADAVFTTIAETGADGSLAGVTILAGTILVGRFTALTLASGKARAYKTP